MTSDVAGVLVGVCDQVMALLPELLARRTEITWKPDGSPVTAADVLLENTLRQLLENALSGLSFVGEESYVPGQPLPGPWLALLDPIDGTENFCSGLKEWGVSLGLWHEGRHAGSLLMLPELGERLMSGDRPPPLRSRIVGFSSSFTEAIAEGVRDNRESRITGCAVYNLYNVARGAFARFCNPRGAYAWDLLPGLMLALEQGCEVRVDEELYDGRFLSPDRRYRVDIRHRYDLHPGQGPLGG